MDSLQLIELVRQQYAKPRLIADRLNSVRFVRMDDKLKVKPNNGTTVAVVKRVTPIASTLNNVRPTPKPGRGTQNSTPHFDVHAKINLGRPN